MKTVNPCGMYRLFTFLLIILISGSCARSNPPEPVVKSKVFKLLHMNIWQEGTMVTGGFDAIADVIIQSGADIVTFSEVRNYNNTRFNERITAALAQRGQTFYSFYDAGTGILSKYKIHSHQTGIYGQSNINKAIIQIDTTQRLAVYAGHLDYTHYACYLPRGYDGITWKELPAPVTDVKQILDMNLRSQRDEAIAAFIADAKKEQQQGNIVFLSGDFNEPSHLDWTAATKDTFDHRGTIVPWHNSITLQKNGYVDAYREKYPDPLTHPGFTWTAFNKDVALPKLVWAPKADDRDRIDFIYHAADNRLSLTDVILVGTPGYIINGKGVPGTGTDPMLAAAGIWPSDHQGLMATFKLTLSTSSDKQR